MSISRSPHSSTFSIHTPSPLRYSHLEDKRLKELETAFMEATEIIINDPLMAVFKEKQETQQFMFERIQEIINEGMREANDKYIKEVIMKLEEMNNYNESLKREMNKLRNMNSELQGQIGHIQENFNFQFKNKSKELVLEVKELKTELQSVIVESNMVKKRREELEVELTQLMGTIEDKEREEISAISTIKELERDLEELGKKSLEKEKRLNELEKVTKERVEEKSLGDNERRNLMDKIKEMEKEMSNNEFVRTEMACEFERKIKALDLEISELKTSNSDLYGKMNDNSILESYKKKLKEMEEMSKKEVNDLTKTKSILEDSEFHNDQLSKTIENLKKEIGEITQKLSEERRAKHTLEIRMIELKDSNSELHLINTNLKDELQSLTQEVKI